MSIMPLSSGQLITSIGADTTTSAGTTLTSDAVTANIKSAWVELSASTPYDAQQISIRLANLSAARTNCLIDIGIGAAGSEIVIVPDLLYSGRSTDDAIYSFPISVTAGTRVAARIQANALAATADVICHLYSYSVGRQSFSAVDAHGSNTADSGGTDIDPGTTANTRGAWTEIVAATSHDHHGFVIGHGTGGDTSLTDGQFLYSVAVGPAGSEQVIVDGIHLASSSAADDVQPKASQYFDLQIPAGSRISVAAQSSITDANRGLDVVFYGVR